MPQSLSTMRTAVRALLPNVTTTIFPDAQLDIVMDAALRRVNSDQPRRYAERYTSTGAAFIAASHLSLWVEGLSKVKRVIYPAPVIANGDAAPDLDPSRDWGEYTEADATYIRLETPPISGKDLLFHYTTSWDLNGLDGKTVTTLPDKLVNALSFCGAAFTCYAMADKSAGQIEPQIPGAELINFGSKEGAYRRMGDKWWGKYTDEVGISTTVAAGGTRRAMTREPQFGGTLMTHRWSH